MGLMDGTLAKLDGSERCYLAVRLSGYDSWVCLAGSQFPFLFFAIAMTGCGKGVSLPDSFPTIEELAERSSPYSVPDLDARIESSLEIVAPSISFRKVGPRLNVR